MNFGTGCDALHTRTLAFCCRINFYLVIFATEGVMDCDAMCLLMGPATPLLNLIGFLVFSAIVLCATSGSEGGGHPNTRSWAGMARVAFMHGA